jgi:glycosyltransferase involved in cell wall biosynthesis
VVAVEHAVPRPTPNPRKRLSHRLLARRLGALVSVGENSARMVEHCIGLETGAVTTIHNGVEVAPFEPRLSPSPRPTIGAIGRLSPEKGFDDLPHILTRIPAARAVVLGEGPERARLAKLAAELGVADRFELPGWQESPGSWLSSFDLLAAPSRGEGFPLVTLEAMMAGLPVVATDVGSVSEAIEDRVTGMLVPPRDTEAMAAAIEAVLADPELRERMVRTARERVLAEFTAAGMARNFEALYDRVLSRSL